MNDDSPINIESLIEFFDNVYERGCYLARNEIRDFAVNNFDMKTVLKPVINFINSDREGICDDK